MGYDLFVAPTRSVIRPGLPSRTRRALAKAELQTEGVSTGLMFTKGSAWYVKASEIYQDELRKLQAGNSGRGAGLCKRNCV